MDSSMRIGEAWTIDTDSACVCTQRKRSKRRCIVALFKLLLQTGNAVYKKRDIKRVSIA